MNILIYGKQASGKSTLAQALKIFYENKGKGTASIIEEEVFPTQSKAYAFRRKALSQIRKTLHSPNGHTICITQTLPGRPHLNYVFATHQSDTTVPLTLDDFDYVIKCEAV